MRRALGVASVLTVLSLAGAAVAENEVPTAPAFPNPAPAGSTVAPEFAGGVGNAVTGLFASPRNPWMPDPRQVYAIVGEHLVTGMSRPEAFERAGYLVLRDEAAPDFMCVGRFHEARYGGPNVQLACSDGSSVKLSTQLYGDTAGFGRTVQTSAAASLAYGFRAKAAARHLVVPAGYELVAEDDMLVLKRSGA